MEFHAVVESVKTLHLPELNDEFAQTVGEFENVAKLREMVREQLEAQAKNEYEQAYFDDLIDKIGQRRHDQVSPRRRWNMRWNMLSNPSSRTLADQQMELDTYLKTLKKEKADWMEEDVKPAAQKRLERSLVLDELAQDEKVEVKNEELQKEFRQHDQ